MKIPRETGIMKCKGFPGIPGYDSLPHEHDIKQLI